jgi:hypothetical protein
MKNSVSTSVFVMAALMPIFLIVRWRRWGILASVLLGWVVIHVCNISFPFEEPVDAIFTGLWWAVGWLCMLIWCLPIYAVVLLVDWWRSKHQRNA